MITETTHPGACTVSEAVLCAGDRAPEVIAWAFEVQDRIRADAKNDPTRRGAHTSRQKFPELASCVGSPEARSRLNKSLRWSVANNIHVLTPQLFVDNVKLCDEDVDLGLEYALSIMLDRHAKGTLVPAAGLDAAGAATGAQADDRARQADKPRTSRGQVGQAGGQVGQAGGQARGQADGQAGQAADKSDKPTDKPRTSRTSRGPVGQARGQVGQARGQARRQAGSRRRTSRRTSPSTSPSDPSGGAP